MSISDHSPVFGTFLLRLTKDTNATPSPTSSGADIDKNEDEEETGEFCIRIVTASGRPFLLRAENDEECDEWVRAIHEGVSKGGIIGNNEMSFVIEDLRFNFVMN